MSLITARKANRRSGVSVIRAEAWVGSSTRMRIENRGPAVAENIKVTVQGVDADGAETEGTITVARLAAGDGQRFEAAPFPASRDKILVEWRDGGGKQAIHPDIRTGSWTL
jgi:hypothetical protein